jgi:hypothetical protein
VAGVRGRGGDSGEYIAETSNRLGRRRSLYVPDAMGNGSRGTGDAGMTLQVSPVPGEVTTLVPVLT